MNDGHGAAERVARGVPVHEALDTTSPADWVTLDSGVRQLAPGAAVLLPTRNELRHLPAGVPTPGAASRIALALCHPNGRVRLAALERAAGAAVLRPLLVVRCADWVAPVSHRARELLAEVSGRRLVPLAGLILFLARRERGGSARELLDRALREGPGTDVVDLLTSGDRAVRRLAYRVAVDRRLLTSAELARTAAASDDIRVQTLCAEAALATMGDADVDDVLDPLLSARSPQVRSAGVTGLRRAGRHGEAVAFLADRARVVRACARYVLGQVGTDPLPLYREWCADPAEQPAAAAGLGECGTGEDAETLWGLTAHPVSAVRARAVAGLRALDAVRPDRIRPLLDDPAAPVVRAACLALRPYAAGLERDWLLARTAPEVPAPTRLAARWLVVAQDRARTRGLRTAR
ncbi:hypothetical protein [Streptomyces salyersiae]|uniref:PBS lyase n=1 Tax=Streptomyces salyersiae TaxID=3075530 RepID=A0ABU2RVK2_9ACTN|nr:hypothetical protein [Streptomyces sp. DSM 41770]MDT0431414.1 hypothetical protein [Streptomyces sp. DSM 41770]